jgi:predicted ribosome quality control (RQC) complex YloA/Tae2 family protein
MQTKSVCKFFKWLDKPTCAIGVEVLKQIMKKVNDLKDENKTLVARMKDLENEMESCMERAKQLEKADDKHMEIIKCLQKENGIYRERKKIFKYALLLSWFTMLLVVCVALLK